MYVFTVITTYLKETEVYLLGGNEIFWFYQQKWQYVEELRYESVSMFKRTTSTVW